MEIVFETERMVARKFTEEDLPFVERLLSDPDVGKYMRGSPRKALKEDLQDYKNHGFGMYAIVLKETGELIGRGGPCPEKGQVEAGWAFLPQYWGQGYGSEIGRGVLNHCFTKLGFEVILSRLDPANTAARKLDKRLGKREIGFDQKANRIWGIFFKGDFMAAVKKLGLEKNGTV